ncbi:MAG: hypothetical protein HQL51_14970 [Magnetococcales bacterium]|nr:hypothetical protein [Magnetococcales bacterium]
MAASAGYFPHGSLWAAGDLPSKFSGLDSIVNTRHNLTQNTSGISTSVIMGSYRNNYGEICVYCHTPHGANDAIAAPLWNRTFKGNTYTTYDSLGTSTLTSEVHQPGVQSLTCLSCHDGTVATDSVVNMPGSGKYSAAQKTSQNDSFLNTWTNESGPDATVHLSMKEGECLACHSSEAGFLGAGAADFRIANIGTDLTNDHPVGIAFPQNRVGKDFVDPDVKSSKLAFYDSNSDGKASKMEVRYYSTGSVYRVECASCHDPHGVPKNGSSGTLIPMFLRVDNTNSSGLCLTCHDI